MTHPLALAPVLVAALALPAPAHTNSFYTRPAGGKIGCALAVKKRMICETFAHPRAAILEPDGNVSSCTGRCPHGHFATDTPTLRAGQKVTIGPYLCSVSHKGVRCTQTASGHGFTITPRQIILDAD